MEMDNLILYKSPFTKKRVGKSNDGGYVIVDLPGHYDLFLSGGISGDISFEEQLLSIYPDLFCYAFDGTISAIPNTNKNIIFVNKNLGSTNDRTMTNLQEYMMHVNNIFMKIDIEGHEFRLMPSIIENNLISKVKQLVIEIHSPADIALFPDYFNGLQDIKNENMFDLFKQLNNTHTIVHFHANNGCRMQTIDGINLPHVFELTFIRNDFVSEKKRNTEQLPTRLDMPNSPEKPEYILQGYPYTI
jgi:hypothetical protein